MFINIEIPKTEIFDENIYARKTLRTYHVICTYFEASS